MIPGFELFGDHGLFERRIRHRRVTPISAHVVAAAVSEVFDHGEPCMGAEVFVRAWMCMKGARRGFGYVNLDDTKVARAVDLVAEAIAAGLVVTEGRGAARVFRLAPDRPTYVRIRFGSRFVLPPEFDGSPGTLRLRHAAYLAPMIHDRLTRIAGHPASRSERVPDVWVSAGFISPGDQPPLSHLIPRILNAHEEWWPAIQTQWTAVLANTLFRLDCALPETVVPDEDVNALMEARIEAYRPGGAA